MQPLFIKELSANDFPVDIAKSILHIKNETQAPESLICTSMLSAMAYACQGNINVDSNGIKPVSIFCVTIAGSGERKSSSDKMVSQPILDMDCELAQETESEKIEYESDMELWKLENEHYKKSYLKSKQKNDSNADHWRNKYHENNRMQPKKPHKKTLILDDTTIEGLNDAFANGSHSILLTSNEGGTITNGRIFNASPTLNKYWDNQVISIERKSTASHKITDARLSISLMIQPGIFKKMLEKQGDELRSSGFFARTLICNPISTQGSRNKQNNFIENAPIESWKKENKTAYMNFIEKLRILINQAHSKHKNKDEKIVLRFTKTAQDLWDKQYNYVEYQLNPNGMFFHHRDIASRYMEHVSRVAAVLQYFTTNQSEISEHITALSINIVHYYTLQFMSIFKHEEKLPDSIRNAETLYQWLLSKVLFNPYNGTIKKNDIRQLGPNCIRDRRKLNEAIDILQQQNRIHIFKTIYTKSTIHVSIINQYSL